MANKLSVLFGGLFILIALLFGMCAKDYYRSLECLSSSSWQVQALHSTARADSVVWQYSLECRRHPGVDLRLDRPRPTWARIGQRLRFNPVFLTPIQQTYGKTPPTRH